MSDGYWYLATPYSKFAGGLAAAHELACRYTAKLIQAAVPVYSPIAHSHPVAEIGGVDPLDHDVWLPQCFPLLDAAAGMIVLTAEGWEASYGVGEEVKRMKLAAKPIVYWAPEHPVPTWALKVRP